MKTIPRKFHKKLVRVVWYDIVTSGGWEMNVTRVPAKIESVGMVSCIGNSKGEGGLGEFLTISASWGHEEGTLPEYNQHITIPAGCVTEIHLLNH
jgi:hypothetical protein